MIKKIFPEVKKSFPEIKSKLKVFSKRSFMWSSPITGNVYYNPKQIKGFSKTALKGVIAHELAHQVAYKQMCCLTKLFFKIKYKNPNYKRKVEREADKIAVKKGFGKELIKLIQESYKKFEKQRFLKIQKNHLSIKEINQQLLKRK